MPAARAWTAEHQSIVDILQRAMNLVEPDHPQAYSVADMLDRLLHVARSHHEAGVREALDRATSSLERLLDDVAALRTVRAPGRSPAYRELDLLDLREALESLGRFEDRIGSLVDQERSTLEQVVRGYLEPAGHPVDPWSVGPRRTPRGPRRLESVPGRLEDILAWAEAIKRDWLLGRTYDPDVDLTLRLPFPDHPALADAMSRMDAAIARYHATAHHDPAGALERLRAAVSETHGTLSGYARRFEETLTGGHLPPSWPAANRPTPKPGSAAERVLAMAVAVEARLAALNLHAATRAQVFEALTFEPISSHVVGTLGDSTPRGGLEAYALSANDIRGLKTRPPELAEALAAFLHDWERAHVVGPGFGLEVSTVMSAPEAINQVAQNRFAEAFLRTGHRVGEEANVAVTMNGRRLAVPLANGAYEYVDIFDSVRYEIPPALNPTAPPTVIDITADYVTGRWATTTSPDADGLRPGVDRQGPL